MIVPTYNEVDSIGAVAARLFETAGGRVDLLVVDDNSPDGTAFAVKALQADNDRIHLLERGGRMGLGSAYVAGFRWARERGYTQVVEMDADLSHDPADVTRLLDALDEADLTIGSRYVPGGSLVNWGRVRRFLSQGGNAYARIWLGLDARDATSGFRAFRSTVLTEDQLSSIRSEGYAFQVEMVRRINLAGGTVKEVPIKFVDRTSGRSKMSRKIVIEALVLVTLWGIKDRFLKRGARASKSKAESR